MRLAEPAALSRAAIALVMSTGALHIEMTHSAIIRESAKNYLPSLLVAAIALDHRRQLTPYRTFTDCFGSALCADLPLGPAHICMSTAVQLENQPVSAIRCKRGKSNRACARESGIY